MGHLRAAEEVREALHLARVLFVPSADPPLKRDGPERVAPAAERLAWVQQAIQDNPHFGVDPLELEREGPSYTVDSLELLAGRYGAEKLIFVIGQDAFRVLPSWRSPRRLLRLASVAVMTRPPLVAGSLRDWMPETLAGDFEVAPDGQSARHRETNTRIRVLAISALDISATDIRRRLRAGASVRYLLPESTRQAIVASGIYQKEEST